MQILTRVENIFICHYWSVARHIISDKGVGCFHLKIFAVLTLNPDSFRAKIDHISSLHNSSFIVLFF